MGMETILEWWTHNTVNEALHHLQYTVEPLKWGLIFNKDTCSFPKNSSCTEFNPWSTNVDSLFCHIGVRNRGVPQTLCIIIVCQHQQSRDYYNIRKAACSVGSFTMFNGLWYRLFAHSSPTLCVLIAFLCYSQLPCAFDHVCNNQAKKSSCRTLQTSSFAYFSVFLAVFFICSLTSFLSPSSSLPPLSYSLPSLSSLPPSPVNGSDFLAQIGPTAHLVWNAGSTIACVSIPIIDDERVENDEIFYVNMVRIVNSPSGDDPRLVPLAIIMIMDDDCKHVYCLQTLCL